MVFAFKIPNDSYYSIRFTHLNFIESEEFVYRVYVGLNSKQCTVFSIELLWPPHLFIITQYFLFSSSFFFLHLNTDSRVRSNSVIKGVLYYRCVSRLLQLYLPKTYSWCTITVWNFAFSLKFTIIFSLGLFISLFHKFFTNLEVSLYLCLQKSITRYKGTGH